ncbi:MAG: phosphoglycerate kinase [Candidatus Paceibacterota bacterium]
MKTVKDIEYLQSVKVIMIADFNVPLSEGKVSNDYRLKIMRPTLDHLLLGGAKVILIGHIQSPEGDNLSLAPVATYLQRWGYKIRLAENPKELAKLVANWPEGEILMLENIRNFKGEKENDPKFAKELASLADIYVNEAFSVSHREHASIVGLPKFLPSYAGLEFADEIAHLSKAFQPAHPFLFILGGAKFSTKLPLLEKFLGLADKVFVGGALASDLFKAKGCEVGKSVVSDGSIDLSTYVNNPKILLPLDVTDDSGKEYAPDNFPKEGRMTDSGSKTVEMLKEEIKHAQFILWNGPLGIYEDGFKKATLDVAESIAHATHGSVTSVLGGGDTLAAIAELGLVHKITFMSGAGGAMLEFLAKGTLVGIEVLEEAGNRE